MKKSLLLITFLVFSTSQGFAQGRGDAIQAQDPTTHEDGSISQGNTVKNQVQTQNYGEDSQLNINTQENLEANKSASESGNRSTAAKKNMSVVAEKVAGLLEFKEDGEGIGDKVRGIAKAQNQAQSEIKGELDNLDSRSGFMKALFGSDSKAIKNLNQQMEQNQLRIQQLQELKNQVLNQADETQIQEAIEAMIDQNTVLANQVNDESQIKGVFGWFVRWFNK